jgi:hypothetical protein
MPFMGIRRAHNLGGITHTFDAMKSCSLTIGDYQP